MSIQLNIGANVQPATDGIKGLTGVLNDFARKGQLSINVIEKSMQDLRVAIKQSTDPTEINKLKLAFGELQARLNSLKLEGGLTQQLGGVTRAARLAHSDLEGMAQSIRGLASGSERGVDALSNIAFTFERLKGVSGGAGAALSAIGETLLGPAGLILAFTTLAPLVVEFIKNLFDSSDAAEANKKVLDDLAASIADVKTQTEDLTAAINFANRLGSINVKISGLGDLENLRQQSVANQQKVIGLAEETAKALQNLNDAEIADEKQKSKESAKIHEEAIKSFKEAQKKEAEARDEGRIIFREIELQKVEDAKKVHDEQLKEQKEAQEKLQRQIEEGQRKLAALVKEVAPALFVIPIKFQFSKLDTSKQEIEKALNIISGIRDLSIPIKINPQLDFKGKELEPPKIEDLPIDLGTVGINLKGKEKFDDRLQEGIEKGIIIPITPQVKIEDLKGVPSNEQEKILVDLTKQFAVFGNVGSAALRKIDFSDVATGIVESQKVLKDLTIHFNDVKLVADEVGQAFGDAFLAITKGQSPIKAFFNSIIHSLEQLIAKLIATKIAAFLLNAAFPGSSFGLKALSLVIPGRAEGGAVEAGAGYVVGERGPEFFSPSVAGTIIPNHFMGQFKMPHLQSGGITTSDTVAQLHKAEVIMPLDRLKGILGNQSIDTNINVGGEFVLRGEDLALTLDRFSRRKGRTF